jgi:hypothetical protein
MDMRHKYDVAYYPDSRIAAGEFGRLFPTASDFLRDVLV